MMASVEGQGAAAAAIGASRRRLDRLANKKAVPDAVPLPRVVSERIERKAAYETTKADIAKWQPIVKENREKPTLNFVGVERNKMHRKKSLASINTDFVPENDFEKEIMAHLKEANALTGQDVERAEDLALNELTPEEAREEEGEAGEDAKPAVQARDEGEARQGYQVQGVSQAQQEDGGDEGDRTGDRGGNRRRRRRAGGPRSR